MPKTKKEKITKTTLGELGQLLPVGIVENGKVYRNFEIKRWNMKAEKELGQIRKENENLGAGKDLAIVIAVMCTEFGPWDFKKMKLTEKRLKLTQVNAGDLLYAYYWIRFKALGEMFGLSSECVCKNKFDFQADMREMDVYIADKVEDFYFDYTLRDSIEIRGKEVKGFTLGPPKWSMFEAAAESAKNGMGMVKSDLIIGSIKNISDDDTPLLLIDRDIEEMSKYDIEKITKLSEEKVLGPVMAIEVECDKCQRKHFSIIDWSVDNFFGISSR